MDDQFITQNRPPIRNGFKESLYARISSGTAAPQPLSPWALAFRFGLACLMVLAMALTVSEPARAMVLAWIRQVAGLQVQELNAMPAAANELILSPDARDTLARIQKDYPYEILLPSYVPQGYRFLDTVERQDQSLFMEWQNDRQDQVLLLVDVDHGQRYYTGENAAQEIQVNDQPALFFQGGYDRDHRWDPAQKSANLLQKRGELIYWLISIQNPEGTPGAFSARAELTRMMESLSPIK